MYSNRSLGRMSLLLVVAPHGPAPGCSRAVSVPEARFKRVVHGDVVLGKLKVRTAIM